MGRETGAIGSGKGVQIKEKVVEIERKNDYKITRTDRFKHRTRHFCDSGIIGTKEFIKTHFEKFKHYFNTDKERIPTRIAGLTDIYSLKRLTE